MLLPEHSRTLDFNVVNPANVSSTNSIIIPFFGYNSLLSGFSRFVPEYSANIIYNSQDHSNQLNPNTPPFQTVQIIGKPYYISNVLSDCSCNLSFQNPVQVLQHLGEFECSGLTIRLTDTGLASHGEDQSSIIFHSQSIDKTMIIDDMNLIGNKFISGYDSNEDKIDFIVKKDFKISENSGVLLKFPDRIAAGTNNWYMSIKFLIK